MNRRASTNQLTGANAAVSDTVNDVNKPARVTCCITISSAHTHTLLYVTSVSCPTIINTHLQNLFTAQTLIVLITYNIYLTAIRGPHANISSLFLVVFFLSNTLSSFAVSSSCLQSTLNLRFSPSYRRILPYLTLFFYRQTSLSIGSLAFI